MSQAETLGLLSADATAHGLLELSLRLAERSTYRVEVRFFAPVDGNEVEVLTGGPVLVTIGADEIAAQLAESPDSSGQALSAQLFADPRLRRALEIARARAEEAAAPLRFVLRLPSDDDRLHALRWETLYDLDRQLPLATDGRVIFSRELLSRDGGVLLPRSRAALRALIVVASPDNIDEFGLGALDAVGEIERCQRGLTNVTQRVLARAVDGRPVTASALVGALQEEYDLVYMVCHGTRQDQQHFLWLESEDGRVERVSSTWLAASFEQLARRPMMVILAACESAGMPYDGALSAAGPQLIRAGVGAVLAMSGPVSIDTINLFTPALLRELLDGGRIDQAVAQARATVRQRPDWWSPTLFLRTRDGRLWYDPPGSRPEPGRVTLPPPPRSLPEVREFLDRERAIEQCGVTLERQRRVVITGMPGIGRTTFAAMVGSHAPKGTLVFWHQCHEDEQIDTLLWELAAFLAHHERDDLWQTLEQAKQNNIRPPTREMQIGYLVQALSEGEYLLCLDDADELDDPLLLMFLRRIHQEAPRTRVLLTAREPHDDLSPDLFVALDDLSMEASCQLLRSAGLELADQGYADLYEQTGGNPYLLTLAVNSLGGASDAEARLRDLIESSDSVARFLEKQVDDELGGDERRTMQAVAVLLGYGGTEAALEAMLELPARRPLRELVERGLLTVNTGPAGREYRQNTALRRFYYQETARARRVELHRKAGAFYAATGEEQNPLQAATHYQRGEAASQAVTIAVTSLWAIVNTGGLARLAALLDLLDGEPLEPDTAAALLVTRGRAYGLLGEHTRANELLMQAIEHIGKAPATPALRALVVAARLALGRLLRHAEPETALAHLQRGLMLAQNEGLHDQAASLELTIAAVQSSRGESDTALEAIEQAIRRLEGRGGLVWVDALLVRAMIHGQRGLLRKELADLELAWKASQEIGDAYRSLDALRDLALARWMSGAWVQAAEKYEQARSLAERLGSRANRTLILYNFGALSISRGDDRRARALLEEALREAAQRRQKHLVIYCHSGLAELALRRGDSAEADRRLVAAARLSELTGLAERRAELARRRAELALSLGHSAEAALHAGRAIQLADDMGDAYDKGLSMRTRGEVLLAQKHPQAARAALLCSQRLLKEDPFERARARLRYGEAMLALGYAERGHRHIIAAHATFGQLGAAYDQAESQRKLDA